MLASSQHLTVWCTCMSTEVSECALLRALIKAACGDATSITMTPNTPWRTVGTLLLTDERRKCGGTNSKEGRGGDRKKKKKADGRRRPMREIYKHREQSAERERLRVEVTCDDRM